jgi:dienelactone hydrolase
MKKTIIILFIFLVSSSYSQSNTEKIIFESANPYSFNDIISNAKDVESQMVHGILKVPFDSLNPLKKYPLVIGVAGSLGWKSHHYEYLDMYYESGFATFELNSFKSRNIKSTVGTQNQITISTMVLDAYKAFEKLAEHPNINKNKVSITGWSLGGGVALFTGWLPLKNAINKDLNFASHLAFYPPCFIQPENLSFTQSPIHILIGEIDDWTPAPPCVDLVNKLSNKANIDVTVYKDSHHGFDRESPVEIDKNAYSFKDCLFKLKDNGDILMNYLQIPMTNSFLQKIGFLFCTSRGAQIGGNPIARKKSFEFSIDFMNKTLR